MPIDPSFQVHLEAKRKAVSAAKRALEAAEKKLETLQAELRGWEEAARLLQTPTDSVLRPTAGEDGQEAEDANRGNIDQKRGLSTVWKAVIAHMAAQYPADFSLSDVGTLCENNGGAVKPESVRSQMHTYDERGFVKRTEPGRFQATAAGAAAADVSLGSPKSETAADSSPAAAT